VPIAIVDGFPILVISEVARVDLNERSRGGRTVQFSRDVWKIAALENSEGECDPMWPRTARLAARKSLITSHRTKSFEQHRPAMIFLTPVGGLAKGNSTEMTPIRE